MTPLSLAELRDRPHWSFSSINSLLNICSLQWAFGHVYTVDREFTPAALVFGKAFHAACTYAVAMRLQGRAVTESELSTCFADNFQTLIALAEPGVRFDERNDSSELSAKGQQMTAAWLAAQDPAEEILAVAEVFAAPLAGPDGRVAEKPLIGELDCVVRTKLGQTLVVDWKTSASRWPTAKAHRDLQATAYLLAYSRLHPRIEAEFAYEVVTKTKTPVVERHLTVRTAYDYARLAVLVQTLERLVAQELFLPAEQCFACTNCQYQSACRDWHRQRFTVRSFAAAA